MFHAIELSGVSGRKPRLCHLGTAGGDQRYRNAWLDEAGRAAGIEVAHLNLFPMPSVGDVSGLPVRPGRDLGRRWQRGEPVSRCGGSTGSTRSSTRSGEQEWSSPVCRPGLCAGTSVGRQIRSGPIFDRSPTGSGFVPYSNGVHYDSEPQRRPLFQKLIAEGALPDGYATDDGVGLVYRHTQLVEAVSEIRGKRAYSVTRDGGPPSRNHSRRDRYPTPI